MNDEEERRRLRHDLRSPLVVISGFAGMLAADRAIEAGQRRDYAERIKRAAEELEQLVGDALA